MKPITEPGAPIVLLVVAVALIFAPGLASASQAEEKRGADLLSAVERGERECADLDQADFGAVGEFVMGRMLGSIDAHEGMDRMMASMMGEGGLDRMHEVMGVRFSGCGNPRLPGRFGGMMGAMGMMGGGTMGGGFGPGAMMGAESDGDHGDNDAGAWIAIAILVLVAGGVLAVILFARPGRRDRGSSPLDLLAERFARGEISAEEFAERRRLLEEGAR